MKKYNVKNYIRYKEDVKVSVAKIPLKRFIDYTPKELKVIFLPLVENIGRKFATSQEASGVMSIMDIIQEGSLQLCKAVDKIDRQKLIESDDIEKTLKSFLAKRIRGGIRREIDRNRGTMRIPEHRLNEMRKGKDEKMVRMFFNSIFLSIDAKPDLDENMVYQIPDKSDPYNEVLLNAYLMSLLEKHLTSNEVFVLSKSYGLDGPKWSANEIATGLNIQGVSAYVRISELKRQAVDKLIENVDHSQVIDYL
jgi:DNA-directed RNA polymerase sigma subunit (sigma70/sigma32)